MLIKLHFLVTFECENIQKKKKNTGILMDQQRKCRGSDPHHSLMWLRQHVWLKHTHPPLELSMQHVTSHQSPHIYCMRRYWCQVSSSYVPDGVSPPCSILLPLFAHFGYRHAATGWELWAQNTISIASFLFPLLWQVADMKYHYI